MDADEEIGIWVEQEVQRTGGPVEDPDEIEAIRREYFGEKEGGYLFGSSDEEDLLSIIYKATAEDLQGYIDEDSKDELPLIVKPIKFPLFVRFIRKCNVVWELCITMILFITIVLPTYTTFFRFFDQTFEYAILVMDFIYSIDIIIRLLVEIWRKHTNCKYKVFLVNYTFFLALMDILSIFPLDYLLIYWQRNTEDAVLEIAIGVIPKLFRFYRMSRFFEKLGEDLRSNQRAIAITRYFFVYFLFMHFFACAMFYFGCQKHYLNWVLYQVNDIDLGTRESDTCFVRLRNYKVLPPEEHINPYPTSLSLYIYSMEFVTTIITTVGFGDVYPLNDLERGLSLFMMFIGAIWISGELSSSLTETILEEDCALYSLFYRREGVSDHIAENLGSSFIDKKLRDYYEYLWSYREGINEINVNELPNCLIEEIQYDICEEMFYKSPLFRGLDAIFLQTLAKQAEVRLLNPEIQIIEQGTICKEMYYILQGELGVMNEIDSDHTSIIFRAGCQVGEVNLFYGLPYENTVYTRTVCQLLVISKAYLISHLQNNPHIYTVMRQRIADRRVDLLQGHILVHLHPILNAVYHRDETEMKGITRHIDPKEYPLTIRNSKGFNKLIKGDILTDNKETYIVEMPCTKKELRKIHAKSYREVSVPTILSSKSLYLKFWNLITMSLWISMILTTPYCVLNYKDHYDDTDHNICSLMSSNYHVMILINLIDFIVEIVSACPSTGIRFKLIDGYHINRGLWHFYLDLIVLIPFELFYQSWYIGIIKTMIKYWKISRMWHYLDQTYSQHIFALRFLKVWSLFFFFLYSTALSFIWLVCPRGRTGECQIVSWFDEHFPANRNEILNSGDVPDESVFVATFLFAAATLTAIGFGNVAPQTIPEEIWLTIVMAISAFMIAYILAELTSAMAALFRPQTLFNQKLQSITDFMNYQGMSERMTARVVEHYTLTNQLTKNCILPFGKTHLLYDAPRDLYEDALVNESEIFFEGVPIFTKMDHKALIRMASSMKRYLLPPEITIVRRGEVRRQLYIIAKGWVALYNKKTLKKAEPAAVYRSTAHFGLKDLLFGQPYQQSIKTLSHTLVYMIDYPIFESVFREDDEFLRFVHKEKKKREHQTAKMLAETYQEEQRDDGPSFLPSWIRYSNHPDIPILMGCTDFDDWERPWLSCYGSLPDFLRYVLMPRSIQPHGSFAKVWDIILGLTVFVNTTLLFFETFMGLRSPGIRWLQFFVDLVFCADLYLRVHWGYQDKGVVLYHPLVTAFNYIFETSFFIDIFLMVPAELFICVLGATDLLGFGPGYSWYSKLRWIRLGRLYKCCPIFIYIHQNFSNRSSVFFIFYLSLAIMISTFLGTIACDLACPSTSHKWEEGDQFKLPACKLSSWINRKYEDASNLIETALTNEPDSGVVLPEALQGIEPRDIPTRWILMLYYIGQVLMGIGSGDLVQYSSEESAFLLFVSLFGFILSKLAMSDMTAAQVDSDEVRAKCREQLNRLHIVLSREGTPAKFIRVVKAQYNLQYRFTRGIQPRDLFSDLHPILESDVFVEYVGDIFDRVPAFRGFSHSVVHGMCKYMRKQYFSRGEMIMRHGSMEYEIFVISGGQVYVTDSQDKWICTLEIGESIGEMSLVYATKRLYSAYAASTLEVFTLTAEDFTEILDRYPSIRENVITLLRKNKRDTFLIKAWKQKANDPEKYSKEQKERTEELATFIRPHELHVDISGYVKLKEKEKYTPDIGFFRSMFSYGEEDVVDNYYFYFASNRYNRFNPVLHPGCKFMSNYRSLMTVIRFLIPCFSIYMIFFYSEKAEDVLTSYWAHHILFVMDCIHSFYIFLQFFTAWELNNQRVYCKTLYKLFLHFLFMPQLFLYNFVAVFPYQYVTGNPGTRLLLFRCILLIDYFDNLIEKKNDLLVSTFQYKLSISLSAFGLLAHVLACLFFWVSCPDTDLTMCRSDSWVVNVKKSLAQIGLTKDTLKPSNWYFMSIYWVISTLTTTGFGEITPINIYEVIVATGCVFFGAFSLSIILGNITTGLASLNQAEREFFYHWRIVINYLRSIGLTLKGQDTLAAFMTMKWRNFRGSNYNESVEVLPTCLRHEACLALFHRCVTHCIFFGKDYGLSFARNVCINLKHQMYLPGMKIANELEESIGLSIVLRGAVTAYQLNPLTGENEFKKRYDQFVAFGKLPALFPDAIYNKSYRAEGTTEVVTLSHDDIRRLLRSFPQWRVYLRSLIKIKYSEFVKSTGLKSIVKKRKRAHGTKRIVIADLLQAEDIITNEGNLQI